MRQNTPSQDIAFPVLIADLGGTNLRVARIEVPGAAAVVVAKLRIADFASLDDAVHSVSGGSETTAPKTAIIAFAGPIGKGPMRLTNHPWDIDPDRLRRRLGLTELILVNDFTAQALALPGFAADDLHQIGGGEPVADAAKLVLGPGTGLGVAGLVPSSCGWTPVPGEAGHIELGARTDADRTIWQHLDVPGDRVSAEQVLSGPGLLRLYRAVARADGGEPVLEKPTDVTNAAGDGDPLAVRTLEIFVRGLGRAAGNLALVFLARGGVFLSGGIAPQILPWLEQGSFRAEFEAETPHQAIIREIPVYLVTAADPALDGLAALANHGGQFGIDLRSRRFRT